MRDETLGKANNRRSFDIGLQWQLWAHMTNLMDKQPEVCFVIALKLIPLDFKVCHLILKVKISYQMDNRD